jgi:hypothetical protein
VSVISNWTNANQHVDTTINVERFTNSAHTVIYARLATSGSTQFYPIGVVQGWSFTEQRQVEEIFELGSDVRYIVPGRTTGQISINRLLISGGDLLNVLYGSFGANGALIPEALTSIKDVTKPIDLLFVTYDADSGSAENMVRYFNNCWIVMRQEQIGANQVVIAENCTLVFENIDTTIVTTDSAHNQAD